MVEPDRCIVCGTILEEEEPDICYGCERDGKGEVFRLKEEIERLSGAVETLTRTAMRADKEAERMRVERGDLERALDHYAPPDWRKTWPNIDMNRRLREAGVRQPSAKDAVEWK